MSLKYKDWRAQSTIRKHHFSNKPQLTWHTSLAFKSILIKRIDSIKFVSVHLYIKSLVIRRCNASGTWLKLSLLLKLFMDEDEFDDDELTIEHDEEDDTDEDGEDEDGLDDETDDDEDEADNGESSKDELLLVDSKFACL